jgi:hypothetical protein
MADFSAISQDPTIRQLVQENLLERAFHDALFPRLLYRMEASPNLFPGHLGDTMIFTGSGLISAKPRPITPGTDPAPSTYTSEQWSATVQQYADSIDTHMPSSALAIADLFMRNAHQLGMSAGQSLDRVARDKLFNAALSGATYAADDFVSTGNQTLNAGAGQVTLKVAYLNGFTKARGNSSNPVRFDTVSATNPLAVSIEHAAGTLSANVVGFTSENAGDEIGPGTLTLSFTGGPFTVNAQHLVTAADATSIVRAGGRDQAGDLIATDVVDLSLIRDAVARMRSQSVPEQADGNYHAHIDPISEAQVFADADFARLLTSMPDYYMYSDFALGKLLGCVFFRNNESPAESKVVRTGGATSTYSPLDPIAGLLENFAATAKVRRVLFVGGGAMNEYYIDPNTLVSEAGITGKTGKFNITNNGISVDAARIQMIIRAPLDRLQQLVSCSYSYIGDFPVRTDAATGDAARYKRIVAIEHGSAS